ncbi:hypothetical protein BC629DRAFT_1286708, partial [Irpex lacteus]
TPLGLVDSAGRVIGVFVGPPTGDPTWPAVMKGVEAALAEAKRTLRFSKKQDRRGTFKTIAAGLSYGGGQTRPGVLHHSKHNQQVLQRLLDNKAVTRVMGYQEALFRWYFPKVCHEYYENMKALLAHYPEFKPLKENSAFAATTFNFGPRVVTYEHTDSGNKANGICPIFCTGDFDADVGGHLILRQLKLLVRFPPGSVALIPSATLMHGNVSVQPGERRQSMTQYTAGGLFRWVQYGFRSWKALSEDPESTPG